MSNLQNSRFSILLDDLTPEQNNELADLFAAEIQKEIDNEILCSVLESTSWIPISVADPDPSIKEWCDNYVNGEIKQIGSRYYFKDEKDATLFALRWRG